MINGVQEVGFLRLERQISLPDISSSEEEHRQHLTQVFNCFKEFGVMVNPSKCQFGVLSLQFLGHTVKKHGISSLESRVSAVMDFPLPKS
uniref:Reverse transcriptase domain-containing protein n=1 Tax=Amphimedon queenslandica TaxID=400682 RepID=A0A1X7V5M7_AMPQE